MRPLGNTWMQFLGLMQKSCFLRIQLQIIFVWANFQKDYLFFLLITKTINLDKICVTVDAPRTWYSPRITGSINAIPKRTKVSALWKTLQCSILLGNIAIKFYSLMAIKEIGLEPSNFYISDSITAQFGN